MTIDKFDIKISQENVLNLIDCYEDNPIYQDVVAEYETILKSAKTLLKPQAILTVAGASPQKIYAIRTVGEAISDYTSSLFRTGNYLGGMLANAIADDMLFQMEHKISATVVDICKVEQKGVRVRNEAPRDMAMSEQKTIVEMTNSFEKIGVGVTDSYMLNPVKSTACIYLLDDDEKLMNVEHDCSNCPNIECKMRRNIPFSGEEDMAVLVEANVETEKIKTNVNEKGTAKCSSEKGIIVDIGTTTIAMQLISLSTGEVEQTFTCINKQRAYGADVISRIEASIAGKKAVLRRSIQDDLIKGIEYLANADISNVSKVIIAGNTTMVHLLMGYDCDTLGAYPFTPINIQTIKTNLKELLGIDICVAEVTIYPGISTYVGGDIVAGLLALGFADEDKVSVMIDLGTNGEMAIGNKDKLLVASTAAGPAFEGGNIACGVASVPGAICSIDFAEKEIKTQTIGDKSAIGICGTGVIEAVFELLESELLDETGLLDDEYFEAGFWVAKGEGDSDISICQKDIREIQLAKSAIRAGFETLVSQYGTSYDNIEHIYIAGGFGYRLNIQKAVAVGLLPKEVEDKVVAVGNTCLRGTYKYLFKKGSEQAVKKIIAHASEVQLSNDKEFNDLYIKHMYFD